MGRKKGIRLDAFGCSGGVEEEEDVCFRIAGMIIGWCSYG